MEINGPAAKADGTIELFATTQQLQAVNTGWFVRNLAKLLAILPVGFLLASATRPEAWVGDIGRAAESLLVDAISGLVLGGALMLPMAVVYLVALALLSRRWRLGRPRFAAVVLSPLVGSLVWLTGVRLSLEAVLIGLGIPLVFSLILTLPPRPGKT